jgi:myo-inositol-1(or 4)-monophosphatase
LTLDPSYLATAVEAALEAGRIHRRYFRQALDVRKKGPIDLVTAADLEVERMFRSRIADRFPDHVVLGEEGGSTAPPPGRCRWIIDPLDGTTNFAHGLGIFCVSIAFQVEERLALGVVYDPIGNELYTAERGTGARVNGRPLAVSKCPAVGDALLCTGFPYTVREGRARQVKVFEAFLTRAQAVRRLGSAALDLCYVAAGRLDGFWEAELNPWDVAAGALIVQEAGGTVSGYDGTPLDVFARHILATNGPLHAPMLEVIRDATRDG